MKISLSRSLLSIGILSGLSAVWSPATVCAADMEFKPFLTVSEEYTDNVYELPDAKRHDLITRLQPGATFRYKAPLWNWDIAYNLDYRNYARSSRDDETTHNADLKGNIFLLDNFLYLDVSDTYQRVTLDVRRDAATESSLFLNQTDQNIATVSPWLLWRPTAKSTLKTGYRYTDTRYWGEGIEKQEQRGYAELVHEITSKLNLTAGYVFTRLTSTPTRYNKHDVSAGFKYEYADKSFLFGTVGNSWQQFDHDGTVDYLFWDAGLIYTAGGAVATLETKVQTTEDPLAVSTKETSYSARLDKTLQRGTLGVSASYTEYVNTQTDVLDGTKLALSGSGSYEVLQSLTVNLGVSAERFSRTTPADLPYRFTGSGGLSYAFKNELTLGLNYSYVTELYDLDTTAGANEINRVILEVKKVF